MRLTEQERPDEVFCPDCGGDAEEVSHDLQELGYLHDDITNQCVECGHMFKSGVPVGKPDETYYEDLRCPAHYARGEEVWGLVKQFKVNHENDVAYVHLKCPRCLYPWTVQRQRENHIWTMGFPQVTGEL